jgi:hypothetical protein
MPCCDVALIVLPSHRAGRRREMRHVRQRAADTGHTWPLDASDSVTISGVDHRRPRQRPYAADSDGTGATLRLANSNTSPRGPQYGRVRRSSSSTASTCTGILEVDANDP